MSDAFFQAVYQVDEVLVALIDLYERKHRLAVARTYTADVRLRSSTSELSAC